VHQSASGKYLVVGFLVDEDVTSPAFWGPDVSLYITYPIFIYYLL